MPQVQGNTTGLSPSAHKTLERLFRRRVPLEQLATPELMKGLADASRETGRQVAAMVHRSGDVEAVIVGDATKLMLPDVGRLRAAEGRLRGLRLIHTHLFGEELTKDDIVDLVRLRLDAIVAIQLAPDGEPRGVHVAHNVPPDPKALRDGEAQRRPPYRTLGPFLPSRVAVDFGALVRSLEEEFARLRVLRVHEAKDGRAILVHVADKTKAGALERAQESLRELQELARTAGVEVVDSVLQLRDRVDHARSSAEASSTRSSCAPRSSTRRRSSSIRTSRRRSPRRSASTAISRSSIAPSSSSTSSRNAPRAPMASSRSSSRSSSTRSLGSAKKTTRSRASRAALVVADLARRSSKSAAAAPRSASVTWRRSCVASRKIARSGASAGLASTCRS